MDPLELLAEDDALPRWTLPSALERLYGGPLGFEEPRTIANFAQSLDGVVAIPGVPRSNALIADESEADRFVMGLLRACADVVLVGPGTLLSSPAITGRADRAYPPAADAFGELRSSRGLPEHPAVAVLTAGGSFDPAHAVLERDALVLTTTGAAPGLAASAPATVEVVPVNDGDAVDAAAAFDLLHRRGHRLVLCEGGPTLFGSLLASRLVDELFLTVSPLLAGRETAPRLSLVEGVELLPGQRLAASLRSVRRDRAHLFLRYALD
jgi:riboflavin biosynthesis pyrimidine reductase